MTSMMTQEVILASAKTVAQSLSALHVKHTDLLDNLKSDDTIEKYKCLSKNIEMIDLGLVETQIMLELVSYLQTIKAEKQKLRMQVNRLTQENSWLRRELTGTQDKLQKSQQVVVQLEEEKKHFEFLASVNQSDLEISTSETNTCEPQIEEPIVDNEEENCITDMSMTHLSKFAQQMTGGYEIPARLRTIHNLAVQYASHGRYEVAVPLCKQALEDLERTSGYYHPDVATMLNILVYVYCHQKNYKKAAKLLNDALEIREKSLGENHPAVVTTLNNLAVLHGKLGQYKDAEPLCKRALEIREKVLGKDHLYVAQQLRNLAILCKNQGKYEEVERCYQRALKIYETKLEPDDPNIAKTKFKLASCYHRQKKYKQAIIGREFSNSDNDEKPMLQEIKHIVPAQ